MIKMLLLRLAHFQALPYLRELKRFIDSAETWEECETAIYEFVRVAQVDVPDNTDCEQDYLAAQLAAGLVMPELKGDEEHRLLRVLFG